MSVQLLASIILEINILMWVVHFLPDEISRFYQSMEKCCTSGLLSECVDLELEDVSATAQLGPYLVHIGNTVRYVCVCVSNR